MNKKEQKKSLLTNIIIVFAILVVVNLISLTVFLRLDFSRGRIYSLSRSSKETVRELEDRLLIKAYFTRNLPPQLADANRYTRDILAEYQAHSRGRIRFEFVDPSGDERVQLEAQQHRINPVAMRVVEQDKLEIREIYMGLVFMYQGKTETIPFIQDTRGLEYDITKTIKKITDIGRKRVGFFRKEEQPPIPTQRGMQPPPASFEKTFQMLSEHFNVSDLDLMEKVPNNMDVIVFAGVKDSLHIEEHYHLDQFLMRGGNLLIFQNRINANLQTLTATPIESNIFSLLEHYGINIKENLVADAECGMIQVQRQQGIFSFATPVYYPFLPIINNVNKEHLIVKNLENLQMLYVSEIGGPTLNTNLKMTPLLHTSSNSGEVSANLDISFERYMQQRNLQRIFNSPPKLVAALFEGDMESYYLHLFPEEDDPKAADFYYRTSDSKIILVPDTEFIQDGAGGGSPSNLDFVLNAVDYLMGDTALIEIRSRETVFKPLKDIGAASKRIVRWTNILLPSFLVIAFGIFTWHKQIKRRKLISKIYEPNM